MAMMKAAVPVERGRLVLEDERIPDVGPWFRPGRRDPADHRRPRCGGRHRGIGHPGQVQGLLARITRPGGTVSSLGVHPTGLTISLGALAAGLGDRRIVTRSCPGSKQRMRRPMSMIRSGRVDLGPMGTHRFRLDDIDKAHELFGQQRDGMLKVAIPP